MKRPFLALAVYVLTVGLAAGQTLEFEAQGGPVLTIRAKAEQQQWLVLGGKTIVAAVVDGRLVIQEFAWPPEPGPGPNPGPNPGPDPGPTPKPTHWQAAFFVESDNLDNLTPAQQALLASLLVRKDLEAKGHRLVGVFDPDTAGTVTDQNLKAWFAAAQGKAPCLAIAPMEGGTIQIFPLPESKDALWKILEGKTAPPPPTPPSPPKQPPVCTGPRCPR